jgi:hypothetical protein
MSSATMSSVFGLPCGMSAAHRQYSPNASMFARTRAVARRYSTVVTPSLPHLAKGGNLGNYFNCHVALSVEIPHTVKISPLFTKPVPTPLSAVTVVQNEKGE